MQFVLFLNMVFFVSAVSADDKTIDLPLITKPETFPTLVNPNCSHCRDEATLRAGDLQDDDRVLCWIRGYSNGGAIPHRFFLNKWRVISDSYGVFVYDSDAGFVRGYAPSYEFSFHGWRNGVMVMERMDGTLFSCLSGEAFAGPGKGTRLEPVPTLPSDWGFWLKHYPDAVAYRMFDKYQSVPLPSDPNQDSVSTRGPFDARLTADEVVLGVWTGKSAKAYPLSVLAKQGFVVDQIDGEPIVVVWEPMSNSAAAYRPVANQPRKFRAPQPDKHGVSPPDVGIPLPAGAAELPSRPVTLKRSEKSDGRITDTESGSQWDVAGRAIDGELTGWTLTWLDSTQVKWFAWSSEYPKTELYEAGHGVADYQPLTDKVSEPAGPLGNLDVSVRHFAILTGIDLENQQVTLQVEGETTPAVRTLEPGAEVWCSGWWGRLDQFLVGDRVWVWYSKSDDGKSISLLADELSEQELYGPSSVSMIDRQSDDSASVTLTMARGGKPLSRTIGLPDADSLASLKVRDFLYYQTTETATRLALTSAEFEHRRETQMAGLVERWTNDGLPGTLVFQHEDPQRIELMLDHESMLWGRALRGGDTLTLTLADNMSVIAVVRQLRPWRERTQVLLQVESEMPPDFRIGQRVLVKLSTVPTRIAPRDLPGIDQSRTSAERMDWLMSVIYCTCGMHDMCAGHFYTLAACDAAGKTPCGLAKRTRTEIAEQIAQGRTDRQILEQLVKERGTKLLRPHMSP